MEYFTILLQHLLSFDHVLQYYLALNVDIFKDIYGLFLQIIL